MIKAYMKRGKKLYEVYVATRDNTKKLVARRRRGIPSERIAKDVEFQFKSELKLIADAAPVWTWERWHSECISRMKLTLKVGTIMNYDGRLKKWIPASWLSQELKSISASDVAKFLEESGCENSPISQKNLLKLVRRIFEMAVEDGIISRNPALGLKIKAPQVVQKVLTAEEAKLLLQIARTTGHRFFPIWACALKSGMRSGELYALRWSDIDLDANLIHVTKQWTSKDGFGPPKNRENRVVPISPDFKEFLIELRQNMRSETDFVLPHLDEWTHGEQAQVTREFCHSIGITAVKFHDLRATFITNLLSQGVPLVKVMAIVGHRKMSTTDVYLRLAGVNIKGATDLMGYELPSASQGNNVFQLISRAKV